MPESSAYAGIPVFHFGYILTAEAMILFMENRLREKRIKILVGITLAVAAIGLGIAVSAFGHREETYQAAESETVSAAATGTEETAETEAAAAAVETAETEAAAAEETAETEDDGSAEEKAEDVKNSKDAEMEEEEPEGYDIVLSFAGDICFDDSCAVMQDYIGQGEKLENNIAPELIKMMRDADVCFVNNEFAYSDRGKPLENKMYTFRASPERASMLQELGVDIAGLANNHVYDFGAEAMEDTFLALNQIGIDYVGAGRNLEEAMTPVYREIDGIKIAYVAASRAEKFKMTPQATEDAAGILRCYDTELFLQEIREARAQADYVIAIVHWGTEYSTELEEVQTVTGREYIDAGADIVIGGHTHCLQGMEYYKGKPILYSLGNFWFNDKPLDSMLVQVRLSGDDKASEITDEHVEVQIVPARQENCKTRILEGEDAERLFNDLERISEGVAIDEKGVMHIIP